eukprot:m.97454 g.97454  ORF g.97454 m.97454 type:complete len:426 (+) comp16699_c0_seq1:352-1629(+)
MSGKSPATAAADAAFPQQPEYALRQMTDQQLVYRNGGQGGGRMPEVPGMDGPVFLDARAADDVLGRLEAGEQDIPMHMPVANLLPDSEQWQGELNHILASCSGELFNQDTFIQKVMQWKEILQRYLRTSCAALDEMCVQQIQQIESETSQNSEDRSRVVRIRLSDMFEAFIAEVKRRFPACLSVSGRLSEFPSTWEACPRCANGESTPDNVPHIGLPIGDGIPGHVCCHVVRLAPDSEEYNSLFRHHEQSFMQIHAIGRVQNHMQLDRIRKQQELDLMSLMTRDGEQERHERQLFHGTRCHDMLHDIPRLLAEGLDQRLAGVGRFGRGIYFSDDAVKAHMYTPNDTEYRCMLVCSVQLGNTFCYPPGQTDPKLLRQLRGYGSVVGNVTGEREYVVYENSRVMINYVILYKSDLRSTDAAETLADA